jgi:flavin reductase (DIM6/NTAB) family NADH-FMN oxidoreductase RutF
LRASSVGTQAAIMTTQELDAPNPVTMRTVLGHFCTGVAVITGHDGERPVGFACQSVTSVSLDRRPLLFYRGGYGGFA